MLDVLLLSFVGALVYTILTSGLGYTIACSKNEEYYSNYCKESGKRTGYAIFMVIINFVWLFLYMYCLCTAQTSITVIQLIWPPLLLGEIILSIIGMNDYEWKIT